VRDGRFYLCTRPPHLEAVHPEALRGVTVGDGIDLDRPDLVDVLRRYLDRVEPLRACALCTGGAGAWEPHAQLPRTLSEKS
jgi:cyclic pyranopterin phosphate synthase